MLAACISGAEVYTPRSPRKNQYYRYVEARVVCTGKNSRVQERFTALDWLARLVTHIPNKGEQLVQYYGYYSNKDKPSRKTVEYGNILEVDFDACRSIHDGPIHQLPFEDAYSQVSPYDDQEF